MTVNQLFQIVPDPRRTENAKLLKDDSGLQELLLIRQHVQRAFDGSKSKNVYAYAEYILRLFNQTQDGHTPPITLFSELPLVTGEIDNVEFIQIPYGAQIVAIDGETQVAALYEASHRVPKSRAEMVPVYIRHGHSETWARQVFHDVNLLAIRPNTTLSLGMDARDPITQISRQVEAHVPFFKDRVQMLRGGLRKSDREVVTLNVLRTACLAFVEGVVVMGSRRGRASFMEPERVDQMTAAAIDWFNTVTQTLGKEIEDRQNTMVASAPAMVALGAVGHSLLSFNVGHDRMQEQDRLMTQLQAVKWDRGDRWIGIAAHWTPSGTFSMDNPNTAVRPIHVAVTDADHESYAKVRE